METFSLRWSVSFILSCDCRGHRGQDVIDELRKYVVGWLNYYKLSCTYSVIKRLAE